MANAHIETHRKHKQEDYRGLSEDFLDSLWYLYRQDNIISCTKQVYVSSLMTKWTRLFGWTPVFDGMSAAQGHIFILLTDGRLLCLGKTKE